MKAVLASSNAGKLQELRELMAPSGFELLSQSELGISPAVEDGETFVENALKKARHASREAKLPALADDSGLAVTALSGAPGIYSARYAGADATDQDNNAKLVAALTGAADRSAYYYCAIVFLAHAADPTPLIATGRWRGTIIESPRGAGGFGYDPYFIPDGESRTAAELAPAEKHAQSHRGHAVRDFRRQLEALTS